MNKLNAKLKMRLPAIALLAASLLFWGLYERYEPAGPVLLQSPTLADATRLRGDCSETNGHYTLTVEPGGKTASINFRMPDGPRYGSIRVHGRIRTHDVVVGPNRWRCGRLLLVQYDPNNKWIPGHHSLLAEEGTTDWTEAEQIFEVDQQAAHTDLVIQQTGKSGTAEFDRIVVEPVRLRASFIWWRIVFAGLWVGLGVLYFRRCRLDRRKLRLLILLNAMAIIVGTMMPEKWIEDSADYARQEAIRIVESSRTQKPSGQVQQKPASPPKNEDSKFDQFNELIGGVHNAGHFLLFTSLCLLVYLSAALERQHRSYFVKVAGDILLFAAVTESLQHLTLDRTPGMHDWLVDASGMATALLFFVLALSIRKALKGTRGMAIK